MNYFDMILKKNDKLDSKIDEIRDSVKDIKHKQRKRKIQRKFDEINKEKNKLTSPLIIYKFNLYNNEAKYTIEASKQLPMYEIINHFELRTEYNYQDIQSIEFKESQLKN